MRTGWIASTLRIVLPISAFCHLTCAAAAGEPVRPVLSLRTTIPLGDGCFRSVAWSPNGRSIVVGGPDGFIRAFSARTGLPTFTCTTTPEDEDGDVVALACHPDGGLLAGAVGTGVYMWKGEGGLPHRRFAAGAELHWLEFAADGSALLAAGPAGAYRWELPSGVLRRWNDFRRDDVRRASLSTDGRLAIQRGEGEIAVLDGRTLTELRTVSLKHYRIRSFAISPDGRTLTVFGRHANTGWIGSRYDVDDGARRTFEYIPVYVPEGAFDRLKHLPSGKWLLALDRFLGPRILYAITLELVARDVCGNLTYVRSENEIAFHDGALSPDGRAVAVVYGLRGRLRIYDLEEDLSRQRIVPGRAGPETVVAALPVPGREYFLISRAKYRSAWFRWEASRAGVVGVVSRETIDLPNGDDGGLPNRLELFDAAAGRTLQRFDDDWKDHSVCGFAVLPNGKEAVVGVRRRGLQIHHLKTGLPIGEPVVAIPKLRWDTRITTSADGRRWAFENEVDGSRGEFGVQVFDAASGARLYTRAWKTSSVTAIALSSDGAWLAVGDSYGGIFLRNLATGAEFETSPRPGPMVQHAYFPSGAPVWSLSFSRDGKRLVSTGGNRAASVTCWDVACGKPVRTFSAGKASFCGALFTPDGKRIVAAGSDRRLHLFDAESGVLQARFAAPPGPEPDDPERPGFASLAASADGDRFVSMAHDAGVACWRFADLENALEPLPDLFTWPIETER